MTARLPEDAVDILLAATRASARLITQRPIIASGRRSVGASIRLMFAPEGDPVVLRSRATGRAFLFLMSHDYLIAKSDAHPQSTTLLTSYLYQILDRDENEILAYHYHPLSRSPVAEPHLHLSNQVRPIDLGRGSAPLPLADLHLTTGPVTLADIVRMLIVEFEVEPLVDNWQALLSPRHS